MSRLLSMLGSWIDHAGVTLAWGLLGLVFMGPLGAVIFSASCAIGFYFDREVRQHDRNGTTGFLEWLDRIMDVAFPLLVVLLFSVWL